jgi:hypothetical protein
VATPHNSNTGQVLATLAATCRYACVCVCVCVCVCACVCEYIYITKLWRHAGAEDKPIATPPPLAGNKIVNIVLRACVS